jgi:hypothetical protein
LPQRDLIFVGHILAKIIAGEMAYENIPARQQRRIKIGVDFIVQLLGLAIGERDQEMPGQTIINNVVDLTLLVNEGDADLAVHALQKKTVHALSPKIRGRCFWRSCAYSSGGWHNRPGKGRFDGVAIILALGSKPLQAFHARHAFFKITGHMPSPQKI